MCHSVKGAENKQGKDIYLYKLMLLQRKPEAHWLCETVFWVRPRVNKRP